MLQTNKIILLSRVGTHVDMSSGTRTAGAGDSQAAEHSLGPDRRSGLGYSGLLRWQARPNTASGLTLPGRHPIYRRLCDQSMFSYPRVPLDRPIHGTKPALARPALVRISLGTHDRAALCGKLRARDIQPCQRTTLGRIHHGHRGEMASHFLCRRKLHGASVPRGDTLLF